MQLEGYQQWINIFDEDISKICQSERTELQNAAMLFSALEKELQNIRLKAQTEFTHVRKELIAKDSLQESSPLHFNLKITNSPSAMNKENEPQLVQIEFPENNISSTESPDLFRNTSHSNNSVFIDLSISDDDATKLLSSPTLNCKFKKLPVRKNKLKEKSDTIKTNLFQNDVDHDSSVIDCTPEVARKKSNTSKLKTELNSKRQKDSTSTILFPKSTKRKVKPTLKKINFDRHNSNETYYEENSDEEPMEITELLDIINTNESVAKCVPNEDRCYGTPKKLKVLKNLEPEPVVRGKARKELSGFSCDKCAKFYGSMKLSPDELQKKIDECSKHRYKFGPPDDTMPGFWDLSFDPPP